MEARLRELRSELLRGQQRMLALERERVELRDTMLRIAGAVQVLEELLGQTDGRATIDGHAPSEPPRPPDLAVSAGGAGAPAAG